MTDNEIRCPCGLRTHMESEDCERTDCNKCCPIAKEESEDDTDDC